MSVCVHSTKLKSFSSSKVKSRGVKGSQGESSGCQRESNNASNQKSSFAKVVQLGLAIAEMRSEVDDIQSFGHKSVYCHNLNNASNQKTSFPKFVQLGSPRKKRKNGKEGGKMIRG